MPEKRLDVKEDASHQEKRHEIHEAVHRKNLSGRNLVSHFEESRGGFCERSSSSQALFITAIVV
jgi:hypothetical protein